MTLAACQESNIPKDIRPLPGALVAKMQQLGMSETSPVLIRIFKESSQLEVWKQRRDGQYALLKTYEICKWSGELGPKKVEGDRQAPEGYYIVTPAQMNPKSSYYLSFNIGYPNAYDRAYGRTGSNLMVHGACSSSGCYSMTDEAAGELFALARDAFKGGQREFQIEAYPFRMTPENMAKHRDNPNMDFWRMLKVGYDHFEVTRQVPKVDVCGKKYVFNADARNARFVATAACPPYVVPPAIASAVAAKEAADEKTYAATVASLEFERGEGCRCRGGRPGEGGSQGLRRSGKGEQAVALGPLVRQGQEGRDDRSRRTIGDRDTVGGSGTGNGPRPGDADFGHADSAGEAGGQADGRGKCGTGAGSAFSIGIGQAGAAPDQGAGGRRRYAAGRRRRRRLNHGGARADSGHAGDRRANAATNCRQGRPEGILLAGRHAGQLIGISERTV